MSFPTIQEYFSLLDKLQNMILTFINEENDFDSILNFFNEQKYGENPEDLKRILYFLSYFTKNHHKNIDFDTKIVQILLYFGDKIKNTFTNFEIFKIFQKNQKILLLLLNKDIITIDTEIATEIIENRDIVNCHFFYPEIKSQIDVPKKYRIQKIENFEEKRQIGENSSYICSLIRKDKIEDFVRYVTQNNLNLSTKIEKSIFETNNFLQKQKTISLIEYATFFGSIQIINFLKMNDVDLTESLWIYAIHSKQPELIHFL